jgi:DNA-binding response OmpR family regulator
MHKAMRILIIDDDPEEIELFQDACTDLQMDVEFFEARDCAEALTMIKEQEPAFIIIDIHLGPQSGIDCLKELRNDSDSNNLPIVMYSTSQTKHHIDRSFNEKADYFFIKPSSMRDIGTIIKKLVSIDWTTNVRGHREAFIISA